MKPLLIAVLLGLTPAARALSFEAQVAGASAAVSGRAVRCRLASARGRASAAQAAPPGFARTIFCARPPKDSGLPEGLRFYTRLDANPPGPVQADETAAALDDYRASYVQGGTYHYDAWSCDTRDYWFTFDAGSLLQAAMSVRSLPLKGHVRIETRAHLDWEGDLECVANWQPSPQGAADGASN